MTHELEPAKARNDTSLLEIAQMVWRRKAAFLLIVLASVGIAFVVTHHMATKWRATAEMVLIQRATNDGGSKSDYAPPIIESVETQMAMLQSDAMPERALSWLQSQPGATGAEYRQKEWTTTAIHRAITISNPKETNVLQVAAEAVNPAQSADLANAVCQSFLIWKKELAQQQVKEIAQSLQVRAAGAAAQMLAAERQEKQFKLSHHLADVQDQEKFLLGQYEAQQTEVSALQNETASLNAKLASLGEKIQTKNALLKDSGGIRDDAAVAGLQSQLTQLEMDRANNAQIYTKDYPGVLPDIDSKIRDVKARLSEAIHGTLTGKLTTLQSQDALLSEYQETQVNLAYTQAKLAAGTRQLSNMLGPITQLPTLDANYKQIARNLDLSNTLYTTLQSNLNAARLDAEIATGSVQITQLASVPDKPSGPNLLQNLSLALIAGIFLGSMAVMLFEQADRRVRNAVDAQRLLSAPIIGCLTTLNRSQAKSLMSGSGGAKVMEAYRYAYANLLLTLHQSHQSGLLDQSVILITSAVSGEGKTVTAHHLARAMARCGKRTILVDADLSVPAAGSEVIAKSGTLESYGLADVLRGKVSLEEAITESEDRNLLILGRGRVDDGCGDLVSLPQMEFTLKALRNMADIVVIDAPACLERPDVIFLSPLADCIVQVVGAGRVDESAIRQAFDSLMAARPRLLTLFVNFSPERRVPLLRASGTQTYTEPAATLPTPPNWDLGEKILMSENKTTKIIVQNLPGGRRAVSLVPPTTRD